MKLGAVLLAAGASQRFGPEDKLLSLYQRKTLVDHAALAVRGAKVHHAIALATSAPVQERLLAAGLEVKLIERAQMAHRLRYAAHWAQRLELEALMVVLGDMPRITTAHLEVLRRAFDPDRPVVTVAQNYLGPPAIFPKSWFPDIADLTGDAGARALFTQDVLQIEVDPWVIHDVDRPEDLTR